MTRLIPLLSALALPAVLLSQDRVRQRPTVVIPNAHGQGRVVVRPSAALPRFSQPALTPAGIRPAIVRPGHSWHWHRHYGWVSLPLAVAPPVMVLPESYALPPQVETYELPAPAQVQVVCPHCGQPITVQLR